ncbi:putative transposable element [Trichonephila clavipes]|nr:putative transposable element [Trichonephila clavipes]
MQRLPRAFFQQDNARPHMTRVSQDCLRTVTTIPWPSRSPDSSPIEHICDHLEERVGSHKKLTVWCALWAGGIIGPYFFKNDEGHNVTVNGDRYRAMITNFFIPELNNHDVQELWFQKDGATCHTARATIDLLKDKSLVYADKPQTLDHLEDNIRRVIADIRPQMLEKVIEYWTSRLDYIRASRGSPMPEIIFKILDLVLNVRKRDLSPTALHAITLETINTRFPPEEWLHIYTDGSLLDFAQGAGIGVFSHLFSFYLHAGPLTTHFDASRVARDKPWSTLCKKSHGIPSSPRAAAVAKFRLLTGHDCLCAHLFRFNLVTSPICVLCDTGQDMTAAHLDECSALNDLNCIVKGIESPLPNDLMVNGLAFVK